MCIILTCDQQIRPDKELIDTCFYNNPDGAGIMWCAEGRVQTAKGFYDPRSLMRAIEAVPRNSRLVVHMRIATSGGIDVGTCHPFPVCDDLDIIHAQQANCLVGLAHNGIISHMPTDDRLGISDTVSFVTDVLNPMLEDTGYVVTKNVLNRMKREAPGNRFAIMTADGEVERVGAGWNTVRKGIQASNQTWRYSKALLAPYYVGRSYASHYGNVWQDGYDDEDGWFDPGLTRIFDELCGTCDRRFDCMCGAPECADVFEAVEVWLDGGTVRDAIEAALESDIEFEPDFYGNVNLKNKPNDKALEEVVLA